MSELGVVAVGSWVAAQSAVRALASVIRDTVGSEVRVGVGNALAVVGALDVALVAGHTIGRCSAVAAVLTDESSVADRRFGRRTGYRAG